jgi:dTDP-glucose pyrophosphorylase
MLRLQGRPILEHILLGLRDAGVDGAAVVTGYLGTQIEEYFGDGRHFSLPLQYFRQSQAGGTAEALQLAKEFVRADPFITSWGDVLIEPSQYGRLAQGYRDNPCDALLFLNAVEDPWRGAAVYTDAAWRVTRIEEKPPRGTSSTRWNNAGVFVLAPVIFEYIERLAPSSRGEKELPQAVAMMIDAGRDVRALPLQGFWSDLGTPDDLILAERTYSAGASAPRQGGIPDALP